MHRTPTPHEIARQTANLAFELSARLFEVGDQLSDAEREDALDGEVLKLFAPVLAAAKALRDLS
jgi:hypothetical protein